MALTGCGRATTVDPAGAPRDELRSAVQATLASKSFVMHQRVMGQAGEVKVIFQAPDRVHSNPGGGSMETIAVGRTMWFIPPALPSATLPD